jgi:hypothetical protein
VKLGGSGGDSFELEIVGYQFPEIADDEWDSNWLLIRTRASTTGGAWTSVDPGLLTGEVAGLAAWLQGIAVGSEAEAELSFVEPNLEFELVERQEERARVRVWFEQESRPAWAPRARVGERDVCVDLAVSRGDLRRAAEDLQEELRRFPRRGPVRGPR